MPGIPSASSNPYPSIDLVMNNARSRVNDMINDAAGDLLADDIPASQTYLTSAWNWLQRQCATAGVETFKRELTIYGVPQRASQDVANQSWITWLGCSDGVNQFEQPCLPQDMILPLSLWRRMSGTTSYFLLMLLANDGLPRVFDTNIFDWREDGLYFYGDMWPQDFQLRYSAYRPTLDITKPQTTVPIMMCDDCMGWRIAFEFANARGSDQAPQLKGLADDAFTTIKMGSTQRRQRQNLRRQPYNRRNSGRGFGYPVR
jgi:hypothetical protein